MPIWITAVGIGCIGIVFGYFLFYSFKRHHPPVSPSVMPIGQLVNILGAIGAGGVLGGVYILLEGVNYIGPYGIGLFLGVAINVTFTILYENPFNSRRQKN